MIEQKGEAYRQRLTQQGARLSFLLDLLRDGRKTLSGSTPDGAVTIQGQVIKRMGLYKRQEMIDAGMRDLADTYFFDRPTRPSEASDEVNPKALEIPPTPAYRRHITDRVARFEHVLGPKEGQTVVVYNFTKMNLNVIRQMAHRAREEQEALPPENETTR